LLFIDHAYFLLKFLPGSGAFQLYRTGADKHRRFGWPGVVNIPGVYTGF